MLMKRSAKLLMIMSENITQESGSFLHLAEVNLEVSCCLCMSRISSPIQNRHSM